MLLYYYLRRNMIYFISLIKLQAQKPFLSSVVKGYIQHYLHRFQILLETVI